VIEFDSKHLMESLIEMKKDWEETHPDKQFIVELFRHLVSVVKKSDKKIRKLAVKGLYDAKKAIVKLMKENNSTFFNFFRIEFKSKP